MGPVVKWSREPPASWVRTQSCCWVPGFGWSIKLLSCPSPSEPENHGQYTHLSLQFLLQIVGCSVPKVTFSDDVCVAISPSSESICIYWVLAWFRTRCDRSQALPLKSSADPGRGWPRPWLPLLTWRPRGCGGWGRAPPWVDPLVTRVALADLADGAVRPSSCTAGQCYLRSPRSTPRTMWTSQQLLGCLVLFRARGLLHLLYLLPRKCFVSLILTPLSAPNYNVLLRDAFPNPPVQSRSPCRGLRSVTKLVDMFQRLVLPQRCPLHEDRNLWLPYFPLHRAWPIMGAQ